MEAFDFFKFLCHVKQRFFGSTPPVINNPNIHSPRFGTEGALSEIATVELASLRATDGSRSFQFVNWGFGFGAWGNQKYCSSGLGLRV